MIRQSYVIQHPLDNIYVKTEIVIASEQKKAMFMKLLLNVSTLPH